jgi:hypothetical protein
MASVMIASGRFHDVVVSASKLVHGTQLEQRDIKALRWAQEVLNVAAETNVVYDMPSSSQLANVGPTAVALKKAADADAPGALSNVRDQLAAALRGDRSQAVISCMATLQQLFSTISRIALQAEVQAKDKREADQPWASLTTTSPS